MQTRQLRRAAERQALKDARKHQNAPAAEPSSRAATNRQNAQHSTGPRTPEGKATSSQNSFKHGLYSKALIYPGENPAELDALKADLRRTPTGQHHRRYSGQRNGRAVLAHPPLARA